MYEIQISAMTSHLNGLPGLLYVVPTVVGADGRVRGKGLGQTLDLEGAKPVNSARAVLNCKGLYIIAHAFKFPVVSLFSMCAPGQCI